VLKKLNKTIDDTKGYHLTGEMAITNNEEVYKYAVDVAYAKENKFRVSLKNKVNNHEQIILRNDEGVYVLTPSLNKSFKFQSEWPYNNSQAYLLQTIVKDLNKTENKNFKENQDGYVFTSDVNYSNNKDLDKQNIYVDKDYNITKVEVIDKNNQVKIKMNFNKYDLKAKFDDSYFTLKESMEASGDNKDTTVSKIEDIIYPMYIPEKTSLTDQDRIEFDNGERVILTFSGDKSFMFVQETVAKEKDILTIPGPGRTGGMTRWPAKGRVPCSAFSGPRGLLIT
jgi:outer membrane lipoprotein-sorting protein